MKMKLSALVLGIVDGVAVSRADSAAAAAGDFSSGLLSGSAICILFGLVCIWFADYLGEFTGPLMRGGYVDSPTPAPLFVAFGWLLMCIPISISIYRLFAYHAAIPSP